VTETVTAALETRAAAPESPYKGLLPYTEADADFFFGRANEREMIASNLLAARLTLLYGPSGVGKSSVLNAGAVRDLHKRARLNFEDDDTPGLAVAAARSWRSDPVAAVKASPIAIHASAASMFPWAHQFSPAVLPACGMQSSPVHCAVAPAASISATWRNPASASGARSSSSAACGVAPSASSSSPLKP